MAPSTASSTMDNVPTSTASGKFVMIARIECTPGKEARLEELLGAARDIVLSGAEPKTLAYRFTRSVDAAGKKGTTYLFFEEYEGIEGFQAHGANPALAEFQKANETEGIAASASFEFFEDDPVTLGKPDLASNCSHRVNSKGCLVHWSINAPNAFIKLNNRQPMFIVAYERHEFATEVVPLILTLIRLSPDLEARADLPTVE
ncbi:hypothetical protein DFH09DRAFT_1290478 [Mycena vulgaris]|nr:hypothetical protein DFH09DRAFT_1290478 [Mycena vulgaris]